MASAVGGHVRSVVQWAVLLVLLLFGGAFADDRPVVVGSKLGAEELLLAEMMAQLLESKGVKVERRMGLGSTDICFPALQNGQLDLYPEYTGTGLELVLKESLKTRDRLEYFLYVRRRFRERFDLLWLDPFGFDNTYALAVPASSDLNDISDLKGRTDLRVGFDFQFMQRPQAWPGLSKAYGLHFSNITEMEHALTYTAIAGGKVDLIDVWSTDGEIPRLKLKLLNDDLGYFPFYSAAPLCRADLLTRYPFAQDLLEQLSFQIDNPTMQALNARVANGEDYPVVASSFLASLKLGGGERAAAPRGQGLLAYMWGKRAQLLGFAGQHLALTAVSVSLGICVGIPLGVLVTRWTRLADPVLGLMGLIQTIPGMALLAFMVPIPGLGLGPRSAVLALFLYSLLPIVRNTYTGIMGIDPNLKEAALGLGMRPRELLFMVEMPLAARTIMAGIRTCAVINVGSATLAAFIGAGGLGVPIVTGMQLNDPQMVLSGAIPSALLALLVDFTLGRVEKLVGGKT